MKYKVGDKVRIKSIDWYNDNKGDRNDVECDNDYFVADMAEYCGKIVTISSVLSTHYYIKEDNGIFNWTDEMIEGLVEEEITLDKIIESKTFKDNIKHVCVLPEGYVFKDENGNIINATKIILEKKEYPKTYKECYKIMNINNGLLIDNWDIDFWKRNLLTSLQKLLIARDAYYKIAGEEMGLDKPWELSIGTPIYYIYYNRTLNSIEKSYVDDIQGNIIFAFPIEEIRDSFYDNFNKDLEFCKELL